MTTLNTASSYSPETDHIPPDENEIEQAVKIDFATEVQSDRLRTLSWITIIFSVLVLMISTIFTSFSDTGFLPVRIAMVVLIVIANITLLFLRRERFQIASWIFSLGFISSVVVMLMTDSQVMLDILPYTYVMVVFVSGLLLRSRGTMIVTTLSILSVIFVPYVTTGTFEFFTIRQLFAVFLTMMSALLAIQVTGELFAVTDWALDNYKRERATNDQLFESRHALQRALLRSEALSERLKRTNEDLEDARASAEIAKQFRGQFLANMSHELRTPLNAIIGFSETMLRFPIMYENVELPDMYRNDLTQIFNSGKGLLTLINDILDLSKIDAGKLEVVVEEVDVASVIESVQATAQGLIGSKEIELITNLPDDLPVVYGDQNRIRQVLLNLYSNAVKFSNHGTITLNVIKTREGLQFSLIDTGDGIAEENLHAIFEEFKQGANNAKRDPRAGSGLGLAISRQLLNLMGGRIWAESQLGKGSTFHFTLPTEPLPDRADVPEQLAEERA